MLEIMLALTMARTPELDSLCLETAKATVAQHHAQGLDADELAISVGVLDRSRSTVRFGSYRGDEAAYPASVVKAFYALYAARCLQDGKLKITPEFERALHDMIVDSSNDATGQVVDILTGTTGGPELSGKAWEDWKARRQVVNRWYEHLGWKGINACQKTWGDGPYGRERAYYGPKFENRNRLTTNACLRLFSALAFDELVPPGDKGGRDWATWLKGLFSRPVPANGPSGDPQSTDFIGAILPKGSSQWSKAGWTSTVRHDSAWVRLPDGRELILVVFTTGTENANQAGPIQTAAQMLIAKAR